MWCEYLCCFNSIPPPLVYLTQLLPWKRASVCLIILQPVGGLLTEQWPGRKSLLLTVWPSIALMQVPARGAPWRVPAEEHHQPWDQLLPDHRAHHLDPVWDSGGRVHWGRPGRLQSACHWVHAAGRWDLVPLSHFQFFSLPNSCCFYQPPCFHLFLFISRGRKHTGLSRLMRYLFTCHTEVILAST